MERIAVLGGGIGALAAVWGITSVPGWRERYAVTVYQPGHLLGGKGASGRNASANGRIEEHGLHIWGGFYDNAFRVMRGCYAELDRPPGAPLRTWEEAFRPRRDIVMQERVDGAWKAWPVQFPDNGGTPGDGDTVPSPAALIRQALTLVLNVARKAGLPPEDLGSLPRLLRAARRILLGVVGERLLGAAALFALLRRARAALAARRERWFAGDDVARRLYMLFDLTLAGVEGAVRDGVLWHGFEAIDDWDLTDWLLRWGASESSARSVTVRAFYDYVFGYLGGQFHQARLAAGTAIQGVLRLMFCYQGSFFYEMNGGMGDVVFAPLYEVLRRRGVRFVFFHRVEDVVAKGGAVEAIHLVRQATLRAGDVDAYQPLVDVGGLPCWPSEPDLAQLDGAAAGVRWTSRWDPRSGGEPVVLRRGADFDQVVLGIPVAEQARACRGLLDADPRYRRMVEGVQTVRTRSAQLWFDADPAQAGAPNPPVISTGFARPFDTWADMSFLLPSEGWGPSGPKFLVYLCGALDEPEREPTDAGYPDREQQRVTDDLRGWLADHAGALWPGLADPGDPRRVPEERLRGGLAGQYVRANIDPSERYVLAAPGTTRLRLAPGDSGFTNLFLAGDWVHTSLPAGCIESAVMGGLGAAEALTGADLGLVGRPTRRVAAPPPSEVRRG